MIDRRSFLRASATSVGVAALGTSAACTPDAPASRGVFSLGVASGLHSPTEVVLWTRVDPVNAPDLAVVTWEVASAPDFSTITAS